MNEQRAIETPVTAPAAPARAPRRWRSVVVVLLLLAAAGALAWWLGERAGTEAPGAGERRRPATTVGIATAATADVPVVLDALGTVTPTVTATVRAQVSGTLQRVAFTEGQLVRAGQLLAVIDPRPFAAVVDQAKGALARDAALLTNAKLDLDRFRTLLGQDSIARQQVDTQASLVRQLEGTVAADRAAVRAAELNVTYSRVTAPVSGRVGLRRVDVGNYVAAGDANGIVVLTQVQPIDVAFTLPEGELNMVRVRQATGAKLPVIAFDRGRSVEVGRGIFSTLDNSVDVTTGTVRAKARFANADNALFPNQFVNIRLVADTLANTVVVPAAALRKGPQGDYVFVVAADRTADLRVVRLGPAMAQNRAILSGVKAGERVVTEGADRLTDGGKVTLPGDRPRARAEGRGERRNRRE